MGNTQGVKASSRPPAKNSATISPRLRSCIQLLKALASSESRMLKKPSSPSRGSPAAAPSFAETSPAAGASAAGARSGPGALNEKVRTSGG